MPFFCPKTCCFYSRCLEIFTPAVIPTATATTTMTNTATGAEPFFVVPFPSVTISPGIDRHRYRNWHIRRHWLAGVCATDTSGRRPHHSRSTARFATFFVPSTFCGKFVTGCVAPPLFPDVQRSSCRSSMISGILLPHWILIHLQHCHFTCLLHCPVPFTPDSCCQGRLSSLLALPSV